MRLFIAVSLRSFNVHYLLRNSRISSRQLASSSVHPCALGNFVDKLLVLAQGEANDVQRVRLPLLDGSSVCSVMGCREHLLYVKRKAHTTLHRASIDRLNGLSVCAQHDHWLYRKRIVDIANRILIFLPEEAFSCTDHPAR